jgi:hypothetical protein
LACAIALAGCGAPGTPGNPASGSAVPTAASGTGPSTTPAGVDPVTPVPAGGSSVGPTAGPTLDWAVVPEPDIRPRRGFEHRFLVSKRGAMIVVSHLVGAETSIVATTRDGEAWEVVEVPSAMVRSGVTVDGGTDWLQVVERADGGPGLELVASPDGRAWETRGRLPVEMRVASDGAVNGDAIVVCGFGRGMFENRASCAAATDGGRSWQRLDDLAAMIGTAQVRGIAAFGPGFVLVVEGQGEFESVAFDSTDATTWRRQRDLIPNSGGAVAAVGGSVVVAGRTETAGSIAATRDGAAWETVTIPHFDGSILWFVNAGDALVAPIIWSREEGGMQVSDFLVSSDGRTWRADGLPKPMVDWQNMTFLPVEGGLIVLGGDPGQLMRGTIRAGRTP